MKMPMIIMNCQSTRTFSLVKYSFAATCSARIYRSARRERVVEARLVFLGFVVQTPIDSSPTNPRRKGSPAVIDFRFRQSALSLVLPPRVGSQSTFHPAFSILRAPLPVSSQRRGRKAGDPPPRTSPAQ
jgi:hypothetical protein